MRLSLSTAPSIGTCSKCHKPDVFVLHFSVILVDDRERSHSGDIEPLCQHCVFEDNGLRSDVPMQALDAGSPPRRKALRRNKRLSQQQERELAEDLGGRVQPNSGATLGAKGDVRSKGVFRLEAKFTHAESFSLQLDDLQKIAGECSAYEKPIVVIDYLEPGTSKLRDRFAVLHYQDTKELLNAAGKHR